MRSIRLFIGTFSVLMMTTVTSLAADFRMLDDTSTSSPPVKLQTVAYTSKSEYEITYPGDVLIPIASPNHFEIIAAAGIGAFDLEHGSLGITHSEIDKLVPEDDDWDNFAAQLGIGYVFFFRDPEQYDDSVVWFPSFGPQLNAYYIGRSNIEGDVWRFGNSNFNELSFTMPVESTRLMLDGVLTIATVKKKLSLYVKGGIGDAWNRAGYRDRDNGESCAVQNLNLDSESHSNFAWEVGTGLFYAFNHRIGVSLEYLYADLGKVKTSDEGTSGTITAPIIVPASFRLNSQAVMLGLHISL